MKQAILCIPLLFGGASCGTLNELLDVPAAVVSDTGAAVDALTPGEQAVVDTVSSTAGTGATLLTGNPAVGAGAAAVVGLLAGFFIRKRRAKSAG